MMMWQTTRSRVRRRTCSRSTSMMTTQYDDNLAPRDHGSRAVGFRNPRWCGRAHCPRRPFSACIATCQHHRSRLLDAFLSLRGTEEYLVGTRSFLRHCAMENTRNAQERTGTHSSLRFLQQQLSTCIRQKRRRRSCLLGLPQAHPRALNTQPATCFPSTHPRRDATKPHAAERAWFHPVPPTTKACVACAVCMSHLSERRLVPRRTRAYARLRPYTSHHTTRDTSRTPRHVTARLPNDYVASKCDHTTH